MIVQLIANHNNKIFAEYNGISSFDVGYNYISLYDNRGNSNTLKYDVLCHRVRVFDNAESEDKE